MEIEQAKTYFEEGFSCAQAVCLAYAEEFGLEQDLAAKVAAGFGGGMGRLGGTCGAVSGAVIVLGLQYGAIEAADTESKEHTYERVREFTRRFTQQHGALSCKDLLGYDISNPEEREQAKEQNLFKTKCPQFVQDAVEILGKMLKEKT